MSGKLWKIVIYPVIGVAYERNGFNSKEGAIAYAELHLDKEGIERWKLEQDV